MSYKKGQLQQTQFEIALKIILLPGASGSLPITWLLGRLRLGGW
jgi:hypothetical protein